MISIKHATAVLVQLAVLTLVGCGGAEESGGATTAAAGAGVAPAAVPAAQPATPPVSANPGADPAQPRNEAPVATSVASGRFTLGTHYRRLSPTQPTSSSPTQVEVAELFWYGCPHCYSFEPFVASWVTRNKPEYVNFVRLPVTWDSLAQLHARAYYTAEALGKIDEMHTAFFNEIHIERKPLDTTDKLRDFFGRFGVSAAQFDETFESPSIARARVGRVTELMRRYQVASVPTIVVNGKYVTDTGMAGGSEALFDLVAELAAAERAGVATAP